MKATPELIAELLRIVTNANDVLTTAQIKTLAEFFSGDDISKYSLRDIMLHLGLSESETVNIDSTPLRDAAIFIHREISRCTFRELIDLSNHLRDLVDESRRGYDDE